jgi:hypothetical protein
MHARALPVLPALSPRSAAAAGAAVLALIVAALVGLFTLGDSATGAASVAGYPPRSHGRVLEHVDHVGFRTAIRNAGDGRQLFVVVPHDSDPSACNVIEPVAKVTVETPTSVTVDVAGYEYLPPPDKQGYSGFSCFVGATTGVPVVLRAPLGSRTVHSDGGPLGGPASTAVVLDPADFPAPRYLPAGYRTGPLRPLRTVRPTTVAEREYRKGADRLVISTGVTADLEPVGGAGGTQVSVAGHRGRIVSDDGVRCVLWSTGGGRGRSVCSYAPAPLTSGDLLKVANGLR